MSAIVMGTAPLTLTAYAKNFLTTPEELLTRAKPVLQLLFKKNRIAIKLLPGDYTIMYWVRTKDIGWRKRTEHVFVKGDFSTDVAHFLYQPHIYTDEDDVAYDDINIMEFNARIPTHSQSFYDLTDYDN